LRVTLRDLKKVLNKVEPKQYSSILKRIFSYPENIDTFAYYFFGHAMQTKTPLFHYEIYDFLLIPESGALAAPRGFAKSTVTGLFYISWLIVNKKKKYIVYMSQNYQKTVQFVEPLRKEFETNEKIHEVYGKLTPRKVLDQASGKNREDMIDINNVRIQAVSFNNNIRGFKYLNQRPDLIIGDDIDDDERVINPDLRYKDYMKLVKQILPSLSNEVGAVFKMIGTMLHWDSLLAKRIKKCHGKIYKACRIENDKIVKDSLLWGDFWGVEKLEAQRRELGSVGFSSEYLNNPIENEASLITMEWLRKCFDIERSYDDDTLKGDNKYLGVDFAFGDRVTNDSSAFAEIVIIDTKKLLNRLIYKKGMSITQQFDYIDQLHLLNNYDCCVMEENSIRSMSKELYHYDFPYYLIWTGSSDTAAKVTPEKEFQDKRHSISKTNMIKRLAVEFENQTIVLPYKTDADKELTLKLCDELLTFALQDGKIVEVGIHADAPIAIGMVLEKHNLNQFVMDW